VRRTTGIRNFCLKNLRKKQEIARHPGVGSIEKKEARARWQRSGPSLGRKRQSHGRMREALVLPVIIWVKSLTVHGKSHPI
jgi:hypothetical protein